MPGQQQHVVESDAVAPELVGETVFCLMLGGGLLMVEYSLVRHKSVLWGRVERSGGIGLQDWVIGLGQQGRARHAPELGQHSRGGAAAWESA